MLGGYLSLTSDLPLRDTLFIQGTIASSHLTLLCHQIAEAADREDHNDLSRLQRQLANSSGSVPIQGYLLKRSENVSDHSLGRECARHAIATTCISPRLDHKNTVMTFVWQRAIWLLLTCTLRWHYAARMLPRALRS